MLVSSPTHSHRQSCGPINRRWLRKSIRRLSMNHEPRWTKVTPQYHTTLELPIIQEHKLANPHSGSLILPHCPLSHSMGSSLNNSCLMNGEMRRELWKLVVFTNLNSAAFCSSWTLFALASNWFHSPYTDVASASLIYVAFTFRSMETKLHYRFLLYACWIGLGALLILYPIFAIVERVKSDGPARTSVYRFSSWWWWSSRLNSLSRFLTRISSLTSSLTAVSYAHMDTSSNHGTDYSSLLHRWLWRY